MASSMTVEAADANEDPHDMNCMITVVDAGAGVVVEVDVEVDVEVEEVTVVAMASENQLVLKFVVPLSRYKAVMLPYVGGAWMARTQTPAVVTEKRELEISVTWYIPLSRKL